jgi:nicotinamidase-related amidase
MRGRKMDILIVVDMQNDFIDGALGSPEAPEIVEGINALVKDFQGKIIFTRDTHSEDYMNTQEGRKLPVAHCIKDTHGWQITDKIVIPKGAWIIDKPTFGSVDLATMLAKLNEREPISSVGLVGLCTDICVISNAMLVKAALPEVSVRVYGELCRGVTPTSHDTALSAMRACQIEII